MICNARSACAFHSILVESSSDFLTNHEEEKTGRYEVRAPSDLAFWLPSSQTLKTGMFSWTPCIIHGFQPLCYLFTATVHQQHILPHSNLRKYELLPPSLATYWMLSLWQTRRFHLIYLLFPWGNFSTFLKLKQIILSVWCQKQKDWTQHTSQDKNLIVYSSL